MSLHKRLDVALFEDHPYLLPQQLQCPLYPFIPYILNDFHPRHTQELLALALKTALLLMIVLHLRKMGESCVGDIGKVG